MKRLARGFFISFVSFYFVVQFFPAVSWGDTRENLLVTACVYGIMAMFVKPVVKTLLLPFNLITFGGIGALVNLGIVYVLTIVLPFFSFSSFFFPGAEVLGFMIPSFNSNGITTAALLSISVGFLSSLLYYLLA